MSDVTPRRHDSADTTRETNARALEIKFLVDDERAAALIGWARTRLEPDPHGTGAHGDEYATSSVYFDTAEHDVLYRRGSFGVAKYRVRRYGTSDVVFVERKLRVGLTVAKRRTRLQVPESQRLELLDLADCAEARWFRRRLIARRLSPACTVHYVRTARIADSREGPVRLTIDRELRATGCGPRGADAPVAQPLLPGRCVLELKFRGPVPALFKELVAAFSLDSQPCSKYRWSMHALGLAAAQPALASRALDRSSLALPKMLEV